MMGLLAGLAAYPVSAFIPLGLPGWLSWTSSRLQEILTRNGLQQSVPIHGVNLVLCRVVSLNGTPPAANKSYCVMKC